MQPRRPDSAKSRVTQKTLDTELNQSKFSQTFTSYTTLNLQKKDDFLKYLEDKEKDPKFKKFNQPSLPQIPQKPTKQQLAKINSKPFQKRNSKLTTSKPKIQQPPKQITTNTKTNLQSSTGNKWTVNHPPQNGIKKENKLQANTSQTFAEKNKQKMNMITAGLKKVENEQKKTDKKIELKGFKVNGPGKKDQGNKVNQEQKQAQNQFMATNVGQKNGEKPKANQSSPQRPQTTTKQQQKPKQKTQEQLKREQQLLEISRFINQVQMKNIDYYPEGYQEFVQRNQSQSPQDLQKININDFLIEPTERDYDKMQLKIRNNEKRLLDEDNLAESRLSIASSSPTNQSSNQTSIDLDKIIDGDSQSEANRQNYQQENEIFLSSISSKDLKERNLFLTQVLKGRVTKQDITKLEQMDKSQIKLKKLQQPVKEDDDIEIMEINMMKKKSNRIFQRNIIEASGQIYRDCDYLSEQNKLRLQRLLNGEMEPSPFEVSEWERFAMRRIDEGIRLYRELSNSSNDMTPQVIPEELLPKDPNLRKQAQKKMLKEKIDSINSRLHQIQHIVVNQAKIQSLIEQHRTTRIAESTQHLIDQRQKQVTELQHKSRQAQEMITKAQKQKGQIEQTLRQMQAAYKQYQQQCKAFQKLSLEQIANRQRQDINEKKKKIQEITKSLQEIQQGTEETIEKYHQEMEHQISILREIQNLANNTQIVYGGLDINLNDQSLNQKFQKRASQDPQLIQMKNKLSNQEEKENYEII